MRQYYWRVESLGLLVFAPAPTIGIATAMVIVPSLIGQAVYVVVKIWLLAPQLVAVAARERRWRGACGA